jgi:Fe-S-cluster containining protein
MCGTCCRVGIQIVPDERWTQDFEDLLLMKGAQFLDVSEQGRRYVHEMVCKNLNLATNKCKIQGRKPRLCKEYPNDKITLLPGCGYHF